VVVLTARAIPLVLCAVVALASGSISRSVDAHWRSRESISRSVDSIGRPVDSITQSGETKVIRVTAERFAFTPSEIVVERGTTVEFHLTSDDTDHGFRIVGTDINVAIPKRRRGETVVRYAAETAGRFTIECSRPCGAGHTAMQASLVVK
jgi:heme/copper-type cytochrome/quinol oxidase subunit 2